MVTPCTELVRAKTASGGDAGAGGARSRPVDNQQSSPLLASILEAALAPRQEQRPGPCASPLQAQGLRAGGGHPSSGTEPPLLPCYPARAKLHNAIPHHAAGVKRRQAAVSWQWPMVFWISLSPSIALLGSGHRPGPAITPQASCLTAARVWQASPPRSTLGEANDTGSGLISGRRSPGGLLRAPKARNPGLLPSRGGGAGCRAPGGAIGGDGSQCGGGADLWQPGFPCAPPPPCLVAAPPAPTCRPAPSSP